jgi:hypothetical protein
MELSARYDSESDVIIATPIGEVTKGNIIVTIAKGLELSKQYNCNLLLFDISKCKIGQSLIEGFNLMRDLNKNTGLTVSHRTAILYDFNIYPNERARFIENVVSNRANPRLRYFTEMKEAIDWLKK